MYKPNTVSQFLQFHNVAAQKSRLFSLLCISRTERIYRHFMDIKERTVFISRVSQVKCREVNQADFLYILIHVTITLMEEIVIFKCLH